MFFDTSNMFYTIDIYNEKWTVIFHRNHFYLRMHDLGKFLGYKNRVKVYKKKKSIFKMWTMKDFGDLHIPNIPKNSIFIHYWLAIHILNDSRKGDFITKRNLANTIIQELQCLSDNLNENHQILLDRIYKLNLDILNLKRNIERKKKMNVTKKNF